jgi:hypothetical protein
MAAVMVKMVVIAISKVLVLFADMAAGPHKVKQVDREVIVEAADITAMAAELAVVQTTGLAAVAAVATQDAAAIQTNIRIRMQVQAQAAENTHQHLAQAQVAVLVYTDKGLTATVSILHGQHQVHHKAVAA